MRIGYARVSTAEPNIVCLQKQQIGLVEESFCDHTSSMNKDRPELKRLMSFAQKRDKVIIFILDRLFRNPRDLTNVTNAPQDQGAPAHSLKERFFFKPSETNLVSTLILQIIDAIEEFEQQITFERQREGFGFVKKRRVHNGMGNIIQ